MGRERDDLRLRVEALGPSPTAGQSGVDVAHAPSSSGSVGARLAERKAYEAEIGELSITCNALREEARAKEVCILEERR